MEPNVTGPNMLRGNEKRPKKHTGRNEQVRARPRETASRYGIDRWCQTRGPFTYQHVSPTVAL
ncbi:MAG: hypothetical protein JWN52_5628 [Actinomycetia bacterium]|nr:hypothetical protein [Actinomycetes bacterium]